MALTIGGTIYCLIALYMASQPKNKWISLPGTGLLCGTNPLNFQFFDFFFFPLGWSTNIFANKGKDKSTSVSVVYEMQTASQMSELIGQLKLLLEGVTLSRFCAPDFPGGSGWKLLTASLMAGSLCSGVWDSRLCLSRNSRSLSGFRCDWGRKTAAGGPTCEMRASS